jgi:hypothetical protein
MLRKQLLGLTAAATAMQAAAEEGSQESHLTPERRKEVALLFILLRVILTVIPLINDCAICAKWRESR